MQKFRKKPVEIEAIQFVAENVMECVELVRERTGHEHAGIEMAKGGVILKIPTLEGTMTARTGDWIIKGVNGEIYPCKPDIFEKTYDRVVD